MDCNYFIHVTSARKAHQPGEFHDQSPFLSKPVLTALNEEEVGHDGQL